MVTQRTGLKLLVVVLLANCLYLFQACSPVYYVSNAHNVPLLKEKHEVRITGGLTATESVSGPELQAAYAVGKNTGLIANGTYLAAGVNDYGYLAEAGGGFFKEIAPQLVAEIYGGAGFAKVVNQRQAYALEMKFLKPFIQPAIGFSSDYFDLAFSPKIALVHYNEPFILAYELLTDANGNTIIDQSGHATYRVIKAKQTFFAFEPAITIRGGWKYAKLQLQMVNSYQKIPNAQNLTFNLGLSVNLAARFKN